VPSAAIRSSAPKLFCARHQWIGILDVQIVEIVAPFIADAQHVLKAGGRNEARLDALALEDGVCDNGGRAKHLKSIQIDAAAEPDEQFGYALDNRFRRVLRRAQHLVQVQLAIVVQQREIREGTAGIECELGHCPLGATALQAARARLRSGSTKHGDRIAGARTRDRGLG
jgi:hypothetical protein